LHGPLTPNEPTDAALRDVKEYSASLPVILVDELVVRRNLPTATAQIIERLGSARSKRDSIEGYTGAVDRHHADDVARRAR
ncbi:MAG TPA: hypothetical protein VGB85_31090, partial [Nannocystis sp.]